MERLTLIGTSHIAEQSIKEIEQTINQKKPDIIAVELDLQRANALYQKQKTKISAAAIPQLGFKGYLFAKIGQIVQQKLGAKVGITPGADMRAALDLAKKNKLQIALIDQPIQITLKKFSKGLTWKERGRFIADIFKGIFTPKKQLKELGLTTFDLRSVPEQDVITQMMKPLKNRYPSIYQTLVEDRNKYMVKKLIQLLRKYPEKNILAVVGAGHVEGMQKLLLKVDVI